jgi:hypothetical protein
MRLPENKTEHLLNVLGNPFLDEFSDNLLRIRRNLLAISSFSLVLVISDVKIEGGSFLGLNVEGLTADLIKNILFFFLLYNLAHFYFQSYDYLLKWRLRLTASLTAGRGFKRDHNEDYSDDPKQSTLYNWWENISRTIKSPSTILDRMEFLNLEFQRNYQQFKDDPDFLNKNNLLNSLSQTVQDFQKSQSSYRQNLEEIKKVIESNRLKISESVFNASSIANPAAMANGFPDNVPA